MGCKAGVHRVAFHIMREMVQFHFIPHRMVEGLILPEGTASPAQKQVRLSRRGAFQPARNRRQRGLGPQQNMNVIRHDNPGSEFIEIPPGLAIEEGVGYGARDSRVKQPDGTESGFVHFAVPCEKGPSCGQAGAGASACHPLRNTHSGYGAGQTPRDKQKGPLGPVGMPVGQSSAVKHRQRVAGESACPTYSAWTGGKIAEMFTSPPGGRRKRLPHFTSPPRTQTPWPCRAPQSIGSIPKIAGSGESGSPGTRSRAISKTPAA